MNTNTVYNVSQLSGSHTDGPRIAGNEASSATNPTFIVDRQDMTTGIGGTSTYVSSIVGGAEITRATSTGLSLNGNLLADHSNSGGSVYLRAYNESTGSGSAAFMEIRTLGTGDAKTIYMLENVSGSDDVTYSVGLDHSDSDKFKISNSSALGTNDRLVIDANGNVGIGTASPGAYKLKIDGGSGDGLLWLEGGTTAASMYFENSQAGSTWQIGKSSDMGTSDDFGFRVEGSVKMVLTDGGNVGIGVTAPDQKLEVAGAIHLSGEVSSPSAPSDGDGAILYAKSDGKLYFISNEEEETEIGGGGGGGFATAYVASLLKVQN